MKLNKSGMKIFAIIFYFGNLFFFYIYYLYIIYEIMINIKCSYIT